MWEPSDMVNSGPGSLPGVLEGRLSSPTTILLFVFLACSLVLQHVLTQLASGPFLESSIARWFPTR